MDNLGEAADLHRGLHDPSIAIGTHHSATTQLPRMLALLAKHDLKATYFIEGWNNAQYDDLIRDSVLAAGHEVGFHAWQHEVWKSLDEETEVRNLDRSVVDAREKLGVRYKGFRPPGGLVTQRTLQLMKERGFTYLSPAADRCAVVNGIAMVPFRWTDIDAYYYMESTKSLRIAQGDGESAIKPAEMKERLLQRINEVLEQGEYMALLFHPFLTNTDEKHKVMEEVVEYVKSRQTDGLWIAQCRDVADWILQHETAFGSDPGWDTAEWKKK